MQAVRRNIVAHPSSKRKGGSVYGSISQMERGYLRQWQLSAPVRQRFKSHGINPMQLTRVFYKMKWKTTPTGHLCHPTLYQMAAGLNSIFYPDCTSLRPYITARGKRLVGQYWSSTKFYFTIYFLYTEEKDRILR